MAANKRMYMLQCICAHIYAFTLTAPTMQKSYESIVIIATSINILLDQTYHITQVI